MEKDRRYKTVKIMIEGGHLTEFSQIFDYIPKSVVANDLGTNYNRLIRLIEHVEQFTLKELFTLSSFCDLDSKLVLDLVYNQYANERKAKKKR
jgi:hypothetical protein